MHFLHADLVHIFFNMFALVSFDSVLEREWGMTRFLIFYSLCGVGAGIAHFAHLGGGAIGFLLMLLWRRTSRT